jgi:hypothetical protein
MMIRTIATLAAAAMFVSIAAGAQAAKNNPAFQADLMKIARGEGLAAPAAAPAADAVGAPTQNTFSGAPAKSCVVTTVNACK